MLGKSLLLLGAAYLICMATLGAWLYAASPGPRRQDITGVAIGRYDRPGGTAYFSGRRLDCEALPATAAYTSRCTISIEGKPLVIDARRNAPPNMNQLGGACAASYDGHAWPCQVNSRHVHTHWFAFLDEPLGLQPLELDALRRRFVIENLPERYFLRAIPPFAVATALVTLPVSLFVIGRLVRERWVVGAASLAYSGLALFMGALAGLWVTGGFWD